MILCLEPRRRLRPSLLPNRFGGPFSHHWAAYPNFVRYRLGRVEEGFPRRGRNAVTKLTGSFFGASAPLLALAVIVYASINFHHVRPRVFNSLSWPVSPSASSCARSLGSSLSARRLHCAANCSNHWAQLEGRRADLARTLPWWGPGASGSSHYKTQRCVRIGNESCKLAANCALRSGPAWC